MSVPSDRIGRLLKEIKRLAAEASMTGSLEGGGRMLASTYNKCLDSIEREDPTIKSLFPSLPEDANMDEVGVAAALLVGYIGGESPTYARREE